MDVAITGISGRFPESDNMAQFCDHLFAGDDMVTEDNRRWEPGMLGLPPRNGKLRDLNHFDSTFFKIHPKQTNTMDAQVRLLLEVTYEAIVDAGVNPEHIRGSRTGVFVGASSTESAEVLTNRDQPLGYELTGSTFFIFANRISYFFDLHGPSVGVDTACSSGLQALDYALKSIRTGQCDAAIVAASNICLNPVFSMMFHKMGALSPGGTCKTFDASADGYARSEAVVAVFLQKTTCSRRLYATVVHANSGADGYKEEGITYPSGARQCQLLLDTYREAGVDPADVTLLEAHGTGTRAGDMQEGNTIAQVFCAEPEKRQAPLLVGSLKSNMGHSESASGLASIAKLLIAMERGSIPPNLHFHTANPAIPALSDGRMQVVVAPTSWQGGYVGVNSFGFGGSIAHVILKSNELHPTPVHQAAGQLRLFTFSARTREGVEKAVSSMQQHETNVQLQALLQNNSSHPASSHPFRGYAVLNSDSDVSEIQDCPSEAAPVWYVFSGMGSQWHGMGRQFLSLAPFHQAVSRADAVLQPLGMSIMELLMESDQHTFDGSLNCFVGIATIQVALVDTLAVMGVQPEGMLGHSVGELACAYADGCLTLEQTVLTAYWRGRCVQDANLMPGAMAAVGLRWQEAQEMCPAGVVAACHNAPGTVTVSGQADKVKQFVKELREKDVFAKEVDSVGIAFHSPCMAAVGPDFQRALSKVITQPKARSERWVSSSIPEELWHPQADTACADYFVANLLNPVLFQEALEHVPMDAILIEIGPHCLLQALLKRSLGTDVRSVGLMKRNHANNMEFLFTSLGKVHCAGVNVDPLALYQPVKYPVSRGTPMISPLICWDHTQSWRVPEGHEFLPNTSSGCHFEMDMSSGSEFEYMLEHVLDGRSLFPATGHLVLAWKALAKARGKQFDQMPVEFRDVCIHRAVILSSTDSLQMDVTITPGTGMFEICDKNALVVSSGRVTIGEDHRQYEPANPRQDDKSATRSIHLTGDDVYDDMWVRGYEYGPKFRVINSAKEAGNKLSGELLWKGNWVTFLDGFLQYVIQGVDEGQTFKLPTRIRTISINPHVHVGTIHTVSGSEVVNITYNQKLNKLTTGGVTVCGVRATATNRQPVQQSPLLQQTQFCPFNESGILSDATDLVAYRDRCEQVTKVGLLKMLKAAKSPRVNGHTHPSLLRSLDVLDTCGIGKEGEDEMSILKHTEGPNSGLLDTLKTVFADNVDASFYQRARDIIFSSHAQLTTDKLLRCFGQERIVRCCLDIVWENIQGVQFNVFEYGASRGQMFAEVFKMAACHFNMELHFTAIDTPGSPHLAAYGDMEISSTQWDLKAAAPKSLTPPAHVVVSCHLSVSQDNLHGALTSLSKLVQDDGFLLLCEPTHHFSIPLMLHGLANNQTPVADPQCRSQGPFCTEKMWRHNIEEAGLRIVAQKSDGVLYTAFLCRKVQEDVSQRLVISVNDDTYAWVDDVKAAVTRRDANVWLMADDSSGIAGFVKSCREEPGGDKIRCILSSSPLVPHQVEEIMQDQLAVNVYRNGNWGTFQTFTMSTGHAYAKVQVKGDLSSIEWIESPLQYEGAVMGDYGLCHVYYATLNFRDIMVASGKLAMEALPGYLVGQDSVLGSEFSGRNQHGDRIFGVAVAKALATTVDAEARLVWPIPDQWTMEEAASVPMAYSTAYYALVVRGRIQRGQKVLIHSGSGGVGQAAITLALHYGCQVYTTVGSQEKRQYLKRVFPELEEERFASSRNTDFEEHFMDVTGGEGMDVVLNSLAGELLQASVRLVASHGVFLEIGKVDLSNNSALGMSLFLRNISFHGIVIDSLWEKVDTDWPIVVTHLLQGIQDGVVKPLQRTVFDGEQLQEAFRYMSRGKHMGKVIVKVREEEPTRECKITPTPAVIQFRRKGMCHPKKSYIIAGGLGGFGLALAGWLVDNGARYLVLTSRSGVQTGFQDLCLERFRKLGADVVVSTLNIVSKSQTEELVRLASDKAPVGGVFNLAMVLRDGLLENLTVDDFHAACDVKAAGARHLDVVTRKMCSDSLHWFVMFSTARDGPAITTYLFANTAMERICELRTRDGLPGLAVRWGSVADVGVVFKRFGGNATIISGAQPQRVRSCLAVLDRFLTMSHPVVESKVAFLDKKATKKSKTSLVDLVAHILGLSDTSSVNPHQTLAELGLDSLMSVEVSQVMERQCGRVFTMAQMRNLKISDIHAISDDSTASGSND